MQKVLMPLCSFLFLSVAKSQTFKKYEIGKSGCAVYMFCAPGRFEEDYSQDSSKVYTAECSLEDGIHYGIVCVKFKDGLMENSLVYYMLTAKKSYLLKLMSFLIVSGYRECKFCFSKNFNSI